MIACYVSQVNKVILGLIALVPSQDEIPVYLVDDDLDLLDALALYLAQVGFNPVLFSSSQAANRSTSRTQRTRYPIPHSA